jgi:hypothetical protein
VLSIPAHGRGWDGFCGGARPPPQTPGSGTRSETVYLPRARNEIRPLFPAAFGYSRNAEQECAAYHKRTGRIIKLLTVQEILDEEHVQKM